MTEKISLRRHIICVDGLTDTSNSSQSASSTNASTISRLKQSIRAGVLSDDTGRSILQEVHYYQAITSGSKFGSKAPSPLEQQIQEIVRDICCSRQNAKDEIFLFGSGRGGYTVRAVAGMLHHMGVPRPGYLKDFTELYQCTLELIKARQEDDSRKGGKCLDYLGARTDGVANIRFVGLFDALKVSTDKAGYDTSFVPSIQNFRHALAFNEVRRAYALDMPAVPTLKEIQGRSFIQAWFLGYHPDMVGGTHLDGLSIYPLQWILVEAMLQGLVAGFDEKSTTTENPLSLAFPQYAGAAPDLDGTEKIHWHLKYVNGISVLMFDPASNHVAKVNAQESSHAISLETISRMNTTQPRHIFDKDGLVGYNKEQTFGNIIHPSVYCILDRNPRFWEQSRFKPYKEQLADFETNSLRADSNTLPPWIEESQLLSSGVKAFRILVCGKTGVGKSTLINKVFGVEMTEESNTYSQGVHDINKAFESPNHPGLLIHDSRGWQAGSDQELDLIAQFLRHRAFQKEPAEALHVIWFCVDSDVSRIEEADKRTFETIAQYSNHVPVFVVGTKKDKLVAFRKMQLLEEYMVKTNDYHESNRLANLEADRLAEEQFMALRDQLSRIKSYKADGYVCLSKDDDPGVKKLLTQTLDMIVDDRVRLFCVAAQVVDVNKKIDSAITECMRLGTHAIRTAMVPLPFSGIIGTPTVSRIICEHVLQCFGFPKAMPEEVEAIMKDIVLGNLKSFMTVTLTQFVLVSSAAAGVAIGTIGIGALLGVASSFLATPPTARMLFKCSCDMILILERSFRYNGKYVSVKQIEDAAKQYTTIRTTTFGGKEKLLQDHIHDEVDRMVPLTKVMIGFRFNKLRTGFEHIVYKNRFDKPPEYEENDPLAEKIAELDSANALPPPNELPEDNDDRRAELPGTSRVSELPASPPTSLPNMAELPGSETTLVHRPTVQSSVSEMSSAMLSPSTTVFSTVTPLTELSSTNSMRSSSKPEKSRSDSSSFMSRMGKSLKIKKTKSSGT